MGIRCAYLIKFDANGNNTLKNNKFLEVTFIKFVPPIVKEYR